MEDVKTSALEQQIRGNWNQFSGRVKEAWGALTNDDVDRAEGRLEQLVGVIQERTGEAREDITERLNKLADRLN